MISVNIGSIQTTTFEQESRSPGGFLERFRLTDTRDDHMNVILHMLYDVFVHHRICTRQLL